MDAYLHRLRLNAVSNINIYMSRRNLSAAKLLD
mgnify:CR=1 FL=1